MASIREKVNPSGERVFHVQIRIKGVPPQTATFERKTDARRWAAETESAIRERRYFKTDNARNRLVGEMIERYITDVVPTKPKAAYDLKSHLGWWEREIGKYALTELTPSLISECRDKLLAGITQRGIQRSPGTVLRYMATLSTVLTTAVRDWNWLDRSPIEKVTKPKPARPRVRYLDDDEREALLAACRESSNPYLYAVVIVAISTGMRLGEILNLRWENIEMDAKKAIGRARLLETKNNDRRSLALTGPAFMEIMKLREKALEAMQSNSNKLTGLVFRSLKLERDEPMDLRTPWETALKNSKVPDFRFHDLRHSAASYLAMNGATPSEIAEILGHRTLQMVKRYAHLSELHTEGVVERMNKRIFAAKTPVPPAKTPRRSSKLQAAR